MNQIAVVYWSCTGNTEAMANAVAEGARSAGAEVILANVADITAGAAAQYNHLALGCPAMGAETLEESEFEPFFAALEGQLSGKTVALFGSYGWGDGEWMRSWQDRCTTSGAVLCGEEGLILNGKPDDGGIAQCQALGKALALA